MPTTEAFWKQMGIYNETTLPVQIAMIVLAVVLIYFVFAIALVIAAIPNVDRKVYVLLLPWALMGLPKCLGALECYEDCTLLGAGVYGLIMLIRNWKAIGKNYKGVH